jgi:hypothetical protein
MKREGAMQNKLNFITKKEDKTKKIPIQKGVKHILKKYLS